MIKRIIFLSLLLATGLFAALEPESVPSMTKRLLDKASYVELARQWREYIEQEGESALAFINLARAYRYSDQTKAAVLAASSAYSLDSDYPPALAELGNLLSQNPKTNDRALELLEHCRSVAPDYEPGLNMLAAIYLKMGKLDKADGVFKDIFSQNLIQRPLQDYGYNMLVGLPEGAVLFTNGDNDTFPPLVLQAGMGFRKDVAVINRSLIKVEPYRKALFKRYPKISFDKVPKRGFIQLGDPVIEKFVKDAKAPLYFAKTFMRMFDPPSVEDGFNDRVIGTGKELPVNESAELFLTKYRLDSATDWSFPWKLYPSIQRMITNYVLAIAAIVERDGLDSLLKDKLLDKALKIAEFHDNKQLAEAIREQLNR